MFKLPENCNTCPTKIRILTQKVKNVLAETAVKSTNISKDELPTIDPCDIMIRNINELYIDIGDIDANMSFIHRGQKHNLLMINYRALEPIIINKDSNKPEDNGNTIKLMHNIFKEINQEKKSVVHKLDPVVPLAKLVSPYSKYKSPALIK